MAILKNTTINDTGSLQLPVGTTAQRPASPQIGETRFNTSVSNLEYFNNNGWNLLKNKVTATTTGGAYTADIVDAGISYKVHAFIGSGSLVVTAPGEVEYLIVAGGGGGGGDNAGGGGAGGFLQGTTVLTPDTYTITVGSGGAGGAINFR